MVMRINKSVGVGKILYFVVQPAFVVVEVQIFSRSISTLVFLVRLRLGWFVEVLG